MAKIKGVGGPTRKTKGSVGDIYTDTTTGKKYKCDGSYGSANHEAEYYWRALEEEEGAKSSFRVPKPEKVEKAAEPVVEETPVEEVVEAEPVSEGNDGEPVEETPVEEAKPNKGKKQRTNYAAAYNK